MIILGIDPGLRHTGIALLKDKKLTFATTIVPKGELSMANVADHILPLFKRSTPTVAAVEEVMWYGRPRKGMMPLATLSGLITGYLLAHDVPVYLLQASFRSLDNLGVKRLVYPKCLFDDHQKDAYQLALIAYRAETDKKISEAIKSRRISPP